VTAALFVCFTVLAGGAPAGAGRPPVRVVDARVDEAVARGLRVLARNQEADGSWQAMIGRKVHMTYRGRVGPHVGVTALACMSFMAGGSLPGRGPYGENVARGLDFILAHTRENGFIYARGSRMYSHGFATLFLAEVYGMTRDRRVREKLTEAVNLIVSGQNAQGGWRYLPGVPDSDMCVTVCQVQALRSARNVGIHVPKATMDAAIRYVRRSWDGRGRGGFLYQIPEHVNGISRTSFALTAAGVTALYGAGDYDAEEIEHGLRYLRTNWPRDYWRAEQTFDFYYGHYYGVQAAFQRGGEYWRLWHKEIVRELLELQERNGAWVDLVGVNYATAMATLILQIPYQYLPIFER
jgi:hypothetical protein